jgi:hypothetical protein
MSIDRFPTICTSGGWSGRRRTKNSKMLQITSKSSQKCYKLQASFQKLKTNFNPVNLINTNKIEK